ncbi:MAG: GYD domain-containing protein [Dongiaceae bacterium]
MPKYIMLANWTNQGVQNIKDSPKRLAAAKVTAKAFGGRLEGFYMTMGTHDMVLVADMPSDDAMAKFILTVSHAGNVRTTSLKAFTESEYQEIVASLGKSDRAKKKKKK